MLAAFPIPITAFQSQLHLGVVKWAHTQKQMEPTQKETYPSLTPHIDSEEKQIGKC